MDHGLCGSQRDRARDAHGGSSSTLGSAYCVPQVLDGHSSTPKKAWFYLRDPYFIESLPAAQRAEYVSEGAYEHGKLQKLKLREQFRGHVLPTDKA